MKVSFESRGDFEQTRAWLKRIAQSKATKALNQIADDGVKSLADNTPKSTGETADGWVAEIKRKKDVSEIAWLNKAHPDSGANMAKLIDQGHGTRTGGYVPPKPFIKQSMDAVFNTAGDKIVEELIK